MLQPTSYSLHPVGLYIHIPFCMKRCGYCAFATSANTQEAAHERYVEAMLAEMHAWEGKIRARTVFFGGGTPSLLSLSLMKRLTEKIRAAFTPEAEAEWTLETHPATVIGKPAKLAALRALGFNRLSFGVESFKQETLRRLEREYQAQDLEILLGEARDAGFSNINLDLILGWPWETYEDFLSNLESAAALSPEHLSLYPLSIEEGTPFQTQEIRTDSDFQAQQFLKADEFLTAQGWDHYEIANYAKAGSTPLTTSRFRSRHNLIYWNYEDYLGLGLGAASKIGNRSFTKAKSQDAYCKALEEGREPPLSEEKEMDAVQMRRLGLIMRLRLKEGVPQSELEDFSSQTREFENLGYLARQNGRLALKPEGWLVSNQLFAGIL